MRSWWKPQWEKYHDELWETLKALWSVWVPSQLVNFAFVPRHFRVPWGALHALANDSPSV